ncbi:MAG: zinc dependent phospholipase C family protein [Hyphomonadaceae bacterium]
MNHFRSVLAALALVAAPQAAHAWGATGHEMVSGLGAEAFPTELPGFVRTRAARETIEALGREPDRWRGAGQPHDGERDNAHFYDGDENNAAMGVVPLAALPETRADYDAALNAGGFDQYKAGYLPYAIMDGWQQLVKDFAIWRASRKAEKNARSGADRAWFRADRLRRETLIIRDIGVWSHYVGDASQPLHASVHYDVWGDFPNPENFNQKRGFHVRFEGAFVRANIARKDVAMRMAAFQECGCAPFERVKRFIAASNAQVVPLFRLEKAGAFGAPLKTAKGWAPDPAKPATPEAKEFTALRLAAGAGELRDLVILAWRASAMASVGWPAVSVADVESGKVVLTRDSYGDD